MFSNSPFKENIFDGLTCLVTGGSSGIGFEIARQIGLHGANIVISGRRKSVLESSSEALAKDGISVHFVQGDVRSYADCERMVSGAEERFGGLNILINAAAGNFLVPAEKLSSNGMKTVLEIDTLGTFNMCRAAFRLLQRTSVPVQDGEVANDAKLRKASESGHSKTSSNNLSCIVNVSATLHYGATWYQVHASAAKSAIDSMTRSLALEWGSYGIRVCGIAPGPIEGTAGLTKLAPGSSGALGELWSERIPVGHPGQTWDIAMGVIFLCSEAGRFVTGHTLVSDGGEWMWRPPLLPRDNVLAASRAIEARSRSTGTGGAQSNTRWNQANKNRSFESKRNMSKL